MMKDKLLTVATRKLHVNEWQIAYAVSYLKGEKVEDRRSKVFVPTKPSVDFIQFDTASSIPCPTPP